MVELQSKFKAQIEELVDASNRLAALGYVTSHGGNLSYRVDEDVVLITPTKVPKRKIGFQDIVILDMHSNVLFAGEGRRPTGETPIHIRIFNRRGDLKGLVHAHPPVLTGFALSDAEILSRPYLPEPIIEVGPVIAVEYAEPLSEELAKTFDSALEISNAFLMKNHGVMVCSSEGIERALDFLEMLEAAAKSVVVATVMGGAMELPENEVAKLERTIKTRGLPLPGRKGHVKSLTKLFF